jgi:hypothetical protein
MHMAPPDAGVGSMIANSFVLNADNAPVVRFIQDQPIVYWKKNDGFIDADFVNFAQKAGRFLESVGKLTDRQMAAVENSMRSKAWIEPERFQPWHEFTDSKFMVNLCPGTKMSADFLAAAKEAVDALRSGEIEFGVEFTIGPVFEVTLDPDDLRLEPLSADYRRGKRAVYETPCRRALRRAQEHHSRNQAA